MGGLSWLSFSADSFSPNSWKFTAVAELVRSVFRTVVILPENRAYIVKSDVRQAYIPDEKTDIVSDDIVFEEFLTDTRTFDDTSYASVLTLLADINTFADATSITVNAAWSDANVTAEDSFTNTSVVFSDGVTRTYFAGDYAAGDYGATDNFIDEAYSAVSTTAFNDSQTTTDVRSVEMIHVAADSHTNTEARTAVFGAVAGDAITVSDASGGLWTFPNWADAAVPIDSVALALTVASTDTSSTSDATSATIQNYALDPTYFSGDYATTPY